MSVTGHGGVYAELGAYYTDKRVADAVVRRLPIEADQVVLEGHAGGGAFLGSLLHWHQGVQLYAIDVDPDCPTMRAPAPRYTRSVQSFLAEPVKWAPVGQVPQLVQGADPYPEGWPRPDWIVGNPPFGVKVPGRKSPLPLAPAHVDRALKLTRRHVVLVLRTGFVTATSYVRDYLSGDRTPRRLWLLHPRPSFSGTGNDMASYCVVWWDLEWSTGFDRTGETAAEWLAWKADP